MTIFFTSDTHFGHASIIRACNRPFADVAEMDEVLIHRWNARVRPTDTVYHLGDFGWRKAERNQEILRRLNGRKILVKGNHDDAKTAALPEWSAVHEFLEFRIDRRLVVLFHYPMRAWPASHHGSLHLFGHTHGTHADTRFSCDAGVDRWDFAPFTLDEAIERMKTMPDRREGWVNPSTLEDTVPA